MFSSLVQISKIDFLFFFFLLCLGTQYNGWRVGLTTAEVYSDKHTCFESQNLDYLNSLVNGWLLGKDGYEKEFLVYNK